MKPAALNRSCDIRDDVELSTSTTYSLRIEPANVGRLVQGAYWLQGFSLHPVKTQPRCPVVHGLHYNELLGGCQSDANGFVVDASSPLTRTSIAAFFHAEAHVYGKARVEADLAR